MPIEPTTEEEAAEAVREARGARAPLAIEGGGTKRGFGRPVQAERTLSLRRLAGITLYEPAEMVIGARAGTPLAELQAALDERGQMLAFEPPDWRSLHGTDGEPTVGGAVACALAGPRRVTAGGLRDSLIGVRFVNGRGEVVKSGGRVMKNVTGLDLARLQAGAHGTLGVLTEAIFKVIPRPEATATLVFRGLGDAEAVALLSAAMGSPYEPTGAAHLPAGLDGAEARTLVRIEGPPAQNASRAAALTQRLAAGTPEILADGADRALWREVRDALWLAEPRTEALWRVSVPPGRGPALAAALANEATRRFYDWSGGLVWLAAPEREATAAAIQREAARCGGHATLLRASEPFRAAVPPFQPLDPSVMKLQSGLKASFDPDGILNPGRMYAGL